MEVQSPYFKNENGYYLGLYDPRNYIPWPAASPERLDWAEKSLLKTVETPLEYKSVKVRHWNGSVCTVVCKQERPTAKKQDIPFVLIHDMFLGKAVWNQNLDELSKKRTTYAFDLLGWGSSSRPDFPADATLAELEWVRTIDDWRKELKIEKMILVGHGLGGFLAASYALEHPSHVRHLVLVDPWGFVPKPPDDQSYAYQWIHTLGYYLSKFNPLTFLRLLGQLAPPFLRIFRADFRKKFNSVDPYAIYEYIYQANARNPTGESALHQLSYDFCWPKRPMIERFVGIDKGVPVTFICGSRSNISPEPFYELQNFRNDCYIRVEVSFGGEKG
uniref:AB hydrolase-1 domain-containing protein n=1 Tax=Bursaphelenchus xylophilus TaxID=6326 RepID=A0A1I7RYL6_BURXY